MYFKSFLLVALCALPAVMADEFKIELDTSNGDTNAAPEHALFACGTYPFTPHSHYTAFSSVTQGE